MVRTRSQEPSHQPPPTSTTMSTENHHISELQQAVKDILAQMSNMESFIQAQASQRQQPPSPPTETSTTFQRNLYNSQPVIEFPSRNLTTLSGLDNGYALTQQQLLGNPREVTQLQRVARLMTAMATNEFDTLQYLQRTINSEPMRIAVGIIIGYLAAQRDTGPILVQRFQDTHRLLLTIDTLTQRAITTQTPTYLPPRTQARRPFQPRPYTQREYPTSPPSRQRRGSQ